MPTASAVSTILIFTIRFTGTAGITIRITIRRGIIPTFRCRGTQAGGGTAGILHITRGAGAILITAGTVHIHGTLLHTVPAPGTVITRTITTAGAGRPIPVFRMAAAGLAAPIHPPLFPGSEAGIRENFPAVCLWQAAAFPRPVFAVQMQAMEQEQEQ